MADLAQLAEARAKAAEARAQAVAAASATAAATAKTAGAPAGEVKVEVDVGKLPYTPITLVFQDLKYGGREWGFTEPPCRTRHPMLAPLAW